MTPEEIEKLVNQQIEYAIRSLKIDLRMERLQRESKHSAGLVGMGLIWGFVIGLLIFCHR